MEEFRQVWDFASPFLSHIAFAAVLGYALAWGVKGTFSKAMTGAVRESLGEPAKHVSDATIKMATAISDSAESVRGRLDDTLESVVNTSTQRSKATEGAMIAVVGATKELVGFISDVKKDGIKVKHPYPADFVYKTTPSEEKDEGLDRAMQLLNDNDPKSLEIALRMLERLALDEKKTSPKVFEALGVVYGRLERHEEALDALTKAATLSPNDSTIAYNIGSVYYKLEKYQDALKWLLKSKELGNNDYQSYIYLGLTYWKLKMFEVAIEATQTLLDLKPENHQELHLQQVARNNVAYYMFEIAQRDGEKSSMKIDQAKELTQMALNFEPDNSRFLDTMGCIRLWEKNYDSAETLFRESLKYQLKETASPRNTTLIHLAKVTQLKEQANAQSTQG